MRASGLQRRWFGAPGSEVLAVAGQVNAVLLEALLKATDYVDVACCELFRKGMLYVLSSL